MAWKNGTILLATGKVEPSGSTDLMIIAAVLESADRHV